MRDGKRLFTSVYVSERHLENIIRSLMDANALRYPRYPSPTTTRTRFFPAKKFERGRIYLRVPGRPRSLDVRGRLRVNMTPVKADEERHKRCRRKYGHTMTRSTGWIHNIPHNNGSLDQWEIHTPASNVMSAGMIAAHPALKAGLRSRQPPTSISATTPSQRRLFSLCCQLRVLPRNFYPHISIRRESKGQTRIRLRPREDGYKFYRDLGPLCELRTRSTSNMKYILLERSGRKIRIMAITGRSATILPTSEKLSSPRYSRSGRMVRCRRSFRYAQNPYRAIKSTKPRRWATPL